jgi:hypothetical protein
MPRGFPSNGPKSIGYKTERGRISIITHGTVNGTRSWTPVLPTESEEDWQKRMDGIMASLNPGSYLEEQLARQAALILQQWDRLHRHEKIKTVHEMREFLTDPFAEHGENSEAALALLETGVGTTREQLTRIDRLQTLLDFMPSADPQKPIADSDARKARSPCARRVRTERFPSMSSSSLGHGALWSVDSPSLQAIAGKPQSRSTKRCALSCKTNADDFQ